MQRMAAFYCSEVERYEAACANVTLLPEVDSFINFDTQKISWNRGLKNDLGRFRRHYFDASAIRVGMYRPYCKQHLYYSKHFNDMVYQTAKIFPGNTSENRLMYMNGIGNGGKDFSVVMVDVMPDLNMQHSGGQGFPLNLYETMEGEENQQDTQGTLNLSGAATSKSKYTVKDGITDAGLAHFQEAYPDEKITKNDLFYYVYGLLHSEDFKSRYADNLTKELPKIPRVKTAADFWAFSQAGRALADLHINYETVEPYPVQFEGGSLLLETFKPEDFRVEQMKFAKGINGEKYDKTRVIYNPKITMTGIPLAAYDYVVNGKPALEWVMERQSVSTHKESGIVNDANLWATETMGDAAYPLKLFQSVITVSLKTLEIVKALPRLNI